MNVLFRNSLDSSIIFEAESVIQKVFFEYLFNVCNCKDNFGFLLWFIFYIIGKVILKNHKKR